MKTSLFFAAARCELSRGRRLCLMGTAIFVTGLVSACQKGFVAEEAANGSPQQTTGTTAGPAATPLPAAAVQDLASAELSGHVVRSAELAKRKPSGEVLFVMARDATTQQIVAVCRVEVPENQPWPVPFTLRDHRLKAGAMVRLSARLDQDGSATTKQPGDEVGEVRLALKVPETDVVLTLDQTL